MMVSAVVEYSADWSAANAIVIAMAGIGLSCALLLRRRS
jgi:hypothetical protein